MKDLKNYIIETTSEIKHKTGNGTGSFSIGDNNLDYFEEVTIYPEPTNNAYELAELHVARSDRNLGIATKLINTFIEFAKSKNKDIVLYASPLDNNMTEKQLFEFYKKFGFEQDSRVKDEHCFILKNNK